MKRTTIFFALAATLLPSCIKDEAPDARMTVTTDKTEYTAGEAVTFRFEGTPDNIVFWSGEPGHEYANKSNYTRVGTFLLDFTSASRYPTSAEACEMRLMVSLDFDGVYDIATIGNEENNWIDITDDCTWGPNGGSSLGEFLSSGELNINELLASHGIELGQDDTIWFAFRYFDDRSSKTQWVIRNTNLDLLSPFGTESDVATITSFGWTSVPEMSNTVTSSQLLIRGNTEVQTIWVVSAGFSAGDVDADTGTPLKSISTQMSEYTYTYDTPGTYTATFETSSVWYTGGNSSVTSVQVNVLTASTDGE